MLMPARLALALQADGWWVRSDIIWHKPNPMPESVTDRPTNAHEHVFLLAKAERYFFDPDAVREPLDSPIHAPGNKAMNRNGFEPWDRDTSQPWGNPAGRNCRNVWTITPHPFAGAHFATYPPELARRCILAGTSERGACGTCGAPWVRDVDKTRSFESGSGRAGNMPVGKNGAGLQGGGETLDVRRGPVVHTVTTGWSPSCKCAPADLAPCTVLDPFVGAGTTMIAAGQINRAAVSIELSAAYTDVSVLRWQAFTGQQATHAVTGRSFADTAAERAAARTHAPQEQEPAHAT
jgi:hypothetical protein